MDVDENSREAVVIRVAFTMTSLRRVAVGTLYPDYCRCGGVVVVSAWLTLDDVMSRM